MDRLSIARLRPWLALWPVFAALLLQLQLWTLIQPYVWFLFYPAVFASSWLGGFAAGIRATVLSALIVLWFFVPPVHTLLKPDPKQWFPVMVFAAMGLLFSLFHERLRRSERLHREGEQQMRRMAHHDALTGMPNRRFLGEALEGAIGRAARHRQRLALLFLDLDRFKLVNDTLGHAAGDRLLQVVAQRLKAQVRAQDLVARLGGDEFTVVMEDLGHGEDAAHLAGKLMEAVARPVQLEGREVAPSVSIGIALYPDDAHTVADLSRAADAAMYRAKERGRHTFEFFTPELTQKAMERLSIENDLRRALAAGEFELYFQPQMSLPKRQLAGMEALLRWNHPQRGLMLPEQFIPVAEECGLIQPIGDWVIRSACRQMRQWREAGMAPAAVAVNVSAAQILHDHLAETVASALADSGLPGSALEVEVTESVLQCTERSTRVLGRLRELGVRIAIDDFGTGFSSLSLLKHLPIHALKVDLLFVRGLPQDKDSLAIVSAMLSMAHDLGLDVVAEGVETEAQRRCLEALGCRLVQGYLFGAAQPAQEAADWLRAPGVGEACNAAAA